MQSKVKLTVLDRKVFPELQAQYLADPNSGACPCYNVGDEFIFERYYAQDFWHMGLNTLKKTAHDDAYIKGAEGTPHCSEAWDAISRYVYAGLQGGSILRDWSNDDRIIIACCPDGTRPVIFKIERMDYKAVYIDGINRDDCCNIIETALKAVENVTNVAFTDRCVEVYLDNDVADEQIKNVVESCGDYAVTKID